MTVKICGVRTRRGRARRRATPAPTCSASTSHPRSPRDIDAEAAPRDRARGARHERCVGVFVDARAATTSSASPTPSAWPRSSSTATRRRDYCRGWPCSRRSRRCASAPGDDARGARRRLSTRRSCSLDSFVAGARGRHRQRRSIRRSPPACRARGCIVGGRAAAGHVAEVVRARRSPYGVDVASGVERAPGVKDHGKIAGVHPPRQSCLTRSGHFGPFGGRYVAETLMPALLELETRVRRSSRRDARFRRELRRTCSSTTSAGRRRSTSPRRLTRAARRRADLPEARGPLPHRRAQDQQHDRPGAARAAHGQAAHHRRDRRRPARRRDGDRRGAVRPAVRGLHGRGGRAAPER